VDKLRREIKLKPPAWINEPRRRFVYAFVCVMWAVSVWVLLTYVTLIRAMEGKKAEQILLDTWGLTLVVEQVRRRLSVTADDCCCWDVADWRLGERATVR